MAAPLPTSVDLRAKMSPVEDQGQLGSCVANATCGALEFLELQGLLDQAKAPEEFGASYADISRLYVYYNGRQDKLHDTGTQIALAIASLKTYGICRESLWPYNVAQVFTQPAQACYLEGSGHKVLASYKVNNANVTEVMTSLAQGYPVIFGTAIFESFESAQTLHTGWITLPHRGEQMLGGHAMLIVGYFYDPSHGLVFIIRNSWGTGVGVKGYFYMPSAYITSTNLTQDCWTVRKEETKVAA